MTAGDLLVRVTAWLAFACYVAGTLAGLRQPAGRVFRWLWLTGATVLLVHLLAAFHFKHGWSHAVAYADTARQTREVTGLDWGGGVYFNYLLVITWLADAALRWCAGADWMARSRRARQTAAAFYAFMWFNAAVVFVPGSLRWLGAAAFVLLAWCVWRARQARPAGL